MGTALASNASRKDESLNWRMCFSNNFDKILQIFSVLLAFQMQMFVSHHYRTEHLWVFWNLAGQNKLKENLTYVNIKVQTHNKNGIIELALYPAQANTDFDFWVHNLEIYTWTMDYLLLKIRNPDKFCKGLVWKKSSHQCSLWNTVSLFSSNHVRHLSPGITYTDVIHLQ